MKSKVGITIKSLVRALGCCLLSATFYPLMSFASNDIYVVDEFENLDITTSHPDEMSTETVESHFTVSLDCTEPKQVSFSIPFGRQVEDQKMRITILDSANISYIGKLERLEDGLPIPRTFEHAYLDYQKGPVSFSLDNKVHDELTFYLYCTFKNPDVTGSIEIEKIEILPLGFIDDRDFAYILALLLLMMFLVPGFLAYAAFFGNGKKERLLALLVPMSLLCFIALYPVLLIHQAWSSTEAGSTLLAAFTTLNLLLTVWIARKGRFGILAQNFFRVRFELLAVAVVVLCLAALVTEGLDLPLHTFNHLHLRNLTYDVFYAHDPLFQYVNGIAIYHDEPFSSYYADGKLVYEVQDRGVVVGVVYAVFRGIASPFGTDIAYSSGYYTLFGAVLNALVLLPLFAIHAYFLAGRARPMLILLLVSASAFMVTNYFITWYKLAGAGVVISGIVLLLIGGNSIRQWAIAGLLWGLATNFHPGLALTYPIITLWLMYRFFLARNKRVAPVVAAFFILLGTFVAMNLPWSVVKATYYEDTNALFRQHFLGFQRHDPEQGIVGSVENFLDKYTLQQQIDKRMERLAGSLRVEEFESLIDPETYQDWDDLMYRWNALETSYMVFVLTPLVVLLILSTLFTRLLPMTAWKTPVTKHRSDFRWLLITQVLSVFLVIFASFGPFEPDINWHIPMSCLVLIIYLLVHANIATGKIGASIIIGYAMFAHYRLFSQYF